MNDDKKIKNISDNVNQEEINQESTPIEIEKTIMPTMMDEEEMEEHVQRHDLSSIIPKFEQVLNSDTNLVSRESELKTDGSVTIGIIDNDVYTPVEKAELPAAIDIKARKAEALKNKNKKKKIDPNKKKKNDSKLQSYTAIGALVVIIGLVCFYIYYKHIPKESDFKPLNISVELGTSLPIRKSDYVKPGIGTEVDEMAYAVDTSKVNIQEVGDYDFTVTFKGMTKTGIISIVDTTGPTLDVKSYTIKKGYSYQPSNFVDNCSDLSGCNYSFEEQGTETKYTEAGKYTIYIVATDAYENRTVKKTTLIIQDIIRYYTKTNSLNAKEGYTLTEDYELHFDGRLDQIVITEGIKTDTYVYIDEKSYKKAKDKYDGELNYSFDDNNLTIVHSRALTTATVGENYSYLADVHHYLVDIENFREYERE